VENRTWRIRKQHISASATSTTRETLKTLSWLGTPIRPSLSLSLSLSSSFSLAFLTSVYFSSAVSEAEIIKLVSRGRTRVLFPLRQKERKSKLQRIKRTRIRMAMMNETSLFLIFAMIVFLFFSVE